MKRKIIIGLVVLAVVALAWYLYKKYKGTSTTGSAPTYTEADIAKKMADIKGSPSWYQSIVAKAATNNRTVADQLRLDAIWMLENVDKK